ncbi:MAG: TetR family transcriptional regulator C-terminal domain-containing protein [Cyclobacteriaceae bacterium]
MGGLNKREHLIETGQNQILTHGYDLSSIKNITAAAGLPKGSFYHYFESKEKFALEAMDQFVNAFEEQLPDKQDNLLTISKLIDARINAIVKINYARECYMSIMSHASTNEDEGFRHSVVNALERSTRTINSLLAKLMKKGLISSDYDLKELQEFVDFSWRGARLKAKLLKSEQPLVIFKKYLMEYILK